MDNQIRILRAMKGVSQQEVADALGVRVQTINAIENNRYIPSLLLGIRIALYFEIPTERVYVLNEVERQVTKVDNKN